MSEKYSRSTDEMVWINDQRLKDHERRIQVLEADGENYKELTHLIRQQQEMNKQQTQRMNEMEEDSKRWT